MKYSLVENGNYASDLLKSAGETWGYHPALPCTKMYNIPFSHIVKRAHCDTLCNNPRYVLPGDLGRFVESVSFFDILLLRRCREKFPKLKYIICNIIHPKMVEHLYRYVDGIIVSPHVLHKLNLVKEISVRAKFYNLTVYAEVNNECLRNCAARQSCRLWLSHYPGVTRCIKSLYPKFPVNMMRNISLYEDLVDIFIINPHLEDYGIF